MKKISVFLLISIFLLIFAACSVPQEEKEIIGLTILGTWRRESLPIEYTFVTKGSLLEGEVVFSSRYLDENKEWKYVEQSGKFYIENNGTIKVENDNGTEEKFVLEVENDEKNRSKFTLTNSDGEKVLRELDDDDLYRKIQ